MKKKTKKIPSLPKYYNGGMDKTNLTKTNWAGIAQSGAQGASQIAAVNNDPNATEYDKYNAMSSGMTNTVGSINPIFGMGVGLGNMIGKPIQASSEQINPDTGKISDPKRAKRNAMIGSIFNPIEAFSYRQASGNWGDVKGDDYVKWLESNKAQQFAMGGMNMMPNAEVEGNEMITSNTPPQTFGAGGVELASNNPYSAPTYKTNGATHEDGGIPVNMQPGSIINGKTKVPAFMANKKGETFAEYMKKLANEENSVVKLKDNILKKAEKGDKYSKNSSDLLSLVLDKKLQGFAELKNKANNIQNAIIANKEQLKAIRKGELPSMDNEQMEPQGMSEASEGEYEKGGIHINPANKGKFTASAERAGMGVQEFARHVLANKEDYSSTQVKRANFARNAAGWKHEMGGVQLPYYNIDSNGNPIYTMGGGYPAMTNPYHNFKGSIPMYMKDGMLPKFEDGNVFDEENPFGYKPQNLAEQYKMNLANTNRNAYKNDEQTNEDRMALNKFWNSVLASKPQNNTPSSNLNQNSLNLAPNAWNWNTSVTAPTVNQANTQRVIPTNETGVMNLNQSSSREYNPNSKKFNWGNLASNVSNFAAQNAGNIYDLTRKNEPLETYERAKAHYLNPKAALRDWDNQRQFTKENIKNASVGNMGSYLSNVIGSGSKIVQGKEATRLNYDNANAQIGNQNAQFNAEMAYREAINRAANAAMKENIRSQAIHGIGSAFGKASKSGKQDEIDQKTLEMYKQYYNNPQFRAALKKAGYDV